jgi:hypothetical protein
MKPSIRAVLALALCLPASALAQQPGPALEAISASGGATAPSSSFRDVSVTSRALFDRLDTNRDGYLTGGELMSEAAAASNWISVDRDRDGRVSRSEFRSLQSGEILTTRRP